MRARVILLTLLVALVSAPVASAETAGGEFVTKTLVQPEGTYLRGEPAAIYANGTLEIERFAIRAPVVDVTRVTSTIATLDDAGGGLVWVEATHDVATYRLLDVEVSLAAGDHSGWFGVYPGSNAQLDANASSRLELVACPLCQKGDAVNPERIPDPDKLTYSYRADGNVVATTMGGVFQHHGRAGVKLQGPDIILIASKNTTTEWTGIQAGSGPISPERRLVQLFLSFDGDLEWESPASVELVMARCTTASDGLVEIIGATGEMRSSSTRYAADEGTAVITGTLEIVTTPLEAADLHVAIAGDVRSTTLQMQRIPLAQRASENVLSGAVIIAAASVLAAGGGMAYAIAVRRRAPRAVAPTAAPATAEAMDVEEFMDLATLASERGDHALGLGWIRRAKARMPDHPEILAQEAFFLNELGEFDEALATLGKASSLSTRGEHDLLAARWLVDRGASEHELRPWIERALERSPELFIELDDDEFQPLMRNAWMLAAIERARVRFETDAPQ